MQKITRGGDFIKKQTNMNPLLNMLSVCVCVCSVMSMCSVVSESL